MITIDAKISGLKAEIKFTMDELESFYSDMFDNLDKHAKLYKEVIEYCEKHNSPPDMVSPVIDAWFLNASNVKYQEYNDKPTGHRFLINWNKTPNGTYATISAETSHFGGVSYACDRAIQSAKDSLKKIDLMKARANKFIKDVRNGNPAPGGYLLRFTDITVDGFYDSCNIIFVNSKVECEVCGGSYTKAGLVTHKGKITCKIAADRNKIEKLKYSVVTDAKIINAVYRGELPGESIPSSYDTYVPDWVTSAYKSWLDKQKQFAGMDVVEYITMMKPEGTDAK